MERYSPKKVIILSRDEMKEWEMANIFDDDPRLRFFIGDVRDREHPYRALDGVDYVVPTAEHNSFECVKTTVIGAMNFIDALIGKVVKRKVAASTEKASISINIYGASKFASHECFVAGNRYAGEHSTHFAVVQYGNVMGPRGSVIPFFLASVKQAFCQSPTCV